MAFEVHEYETVAVLLLELEGWEDELELEEMMCELELVELEGEPGVEAEDELEGAEELLLEELPLDRAK